MNVTVEIGWAVVIRDPPGGLLAWFPAKYELEARKFAHDRFPETALTVSAALVGGSIHWAPL